MEICLCWIKWKHLELITTVRALALDMEARPLCQLHDIVLTSGGSTLALHDNVGRLLKVEFGKYERTDIGKVGIDRSNAVAGSLKVECRLLTRKPSTNHQVPRQSCFDCLARIVKARHVSDVCKGGARASTSAGSFVAAHITACGS